MNKILRSSSGIALSLILSAVLVPAPSNLMSAGGWAAAAARNKSNLRRPAGLGARNRFDPVALKEQQPDIRKAKQAWPLFNGAFEMLSGPGRRAVLVANGIIKSPPKTVSPAEHPSKIASQQISAGDNVRVNDPTMDTTTTHTHSETSIAVNGPFIVETFNDSDFEDLSGYAYSTDGGNSFTHARMPLTLGGQNLGDGTVALGPSGEFYFSEIAFDSSTSFFNAIVGVTKSTDNGVTFSAPIDASTTASNDSDFQDKPWITVDRGASSPFRGNVYVSWTDFTSANGNFINVARSVDGAASFQSPVAISPQTGKYTVQGSMPAVAPNGDLYLAYLDQSNTPANISLVKSSDGGQTFSKPLAASSLNTVNPVTGGNAVRDNSFPSVVVDRTGTVHITYDAEPVLDGPDRSDVFYVRSTDGGHTFSSPVRLNDDATTTTQLFPSIAAAADGTLAVKWWDRRNDPAGDNLTDVYMTISTDGGNSFSRNFRVTNHNWVFAPVQAGFAASYHGDYDGITSDGSNFYLSWSDERSGNPDAFFAFVPLSYNPAAPDYNISAATDYGTIIAGNSTQFSLNTVAANGFAGSLSLSAAPAIPGLTYSFANPSVAAGSAAAFTVAADASTHSGTYMITITAAASSRTRKTNVNLSVYNSNRTATAPIDVSNTPGFSSLQSGFLIDPTGAINLVYDDDSAVAAGGSQAVFSRSVDGGRTYTRPVSISGNSGLAIESTLALDPAGNLYAAWLSVDQVKNTAQVMVSRSADHGATFSTPVGVSPASDQAELPTISADKNGNVTCAYIDIKSNRGLVFVVRSTDGARSFSTPAQVSGAREDASTSGLQIAFNSRGAAYIIYNDQAPASPTINLAEASDGGQFATATVISDTSVPAFTPAIAIDSADNIYVAFSDFFFDPVQGTNAEIVVSRSCDHGASFSAPVDISNNPGESIFPSIVTDSHGNVAVAWEDTDNNLQTDIFVATSIDGGASFQRPVNLSANPGLSTGPAAVFDGSGSLLVAWTDDSMANSDILTASMPGLGPASPDFSLITYPSQVSITGGDKGVFTVLISRSGRFSGNVTVTPSDTSSLKIGLNSTATSSSCTSVTFSFKAAKRAPVGSSNILFTGRDDTGRVRTATLNVVIK